MGTINKEESEVINRALNSALELAKEGKQVRLYVDWRDAAPESSRTWMRPFIQFEAK